MKQTADAGITSISYKDTYITFVSCLLFFAMKKNNGNVLYHERTLLHSYIATLYQVNAIGCMPSVFMQVKLLLHPQ